MINARPNVLLVEDNPADINLVEEALEEAQVHCSLQILRDGERAIEFLDAMDAHAEDLPPDIVLLDLNLPKVGGEEILKRVRLSPKCKNAKVLIISSSAIPADRERVIQLGASDYFRKPLDLEEFMLLGPKVRTMIEGLSN